MKAITISKRTGISSDDGDPVTITIEGLCATCVTVSSWVHSGPVSVTLHDLQFDWLLRDLLANDEIREFIRSQLKEAE